MFVFYPSCLETTYFIISYLFLLRNFNFVVYPETTKGCYVLNLLTVHYYVEEEFPHKVWQDNEYIDGHRLRTSMMTPLLFIRVNSHPTAYTTFLRTTEDGSSNHTNYGFGHLLTHHTHMDCLPETTRADRLPRVLDPDTLNYYTFTLLVHDSWILYGPSYDP